MYIVARLLGCRVHSVFFLAPGCWPLTAHATILFTNTTTVAPALRAAGMRAGRVGRAGRACPMRGSLPWAAHRVTWDCQPRGHMSCSSRWAAVEPEEEGARGGGGARGAPPHLRARIHPHTHHGGHGSSSSGGGTPSRQRRDRYGGGPCQRARADRGRRAPARIRDRRGRARHAPADGRRRPRPAQRSGGRSGGAGKRLAARERTPNAPRADVLRPGRAILPSYPSAGR